MSKICPACGHEVMEYDKFCPTCHAELILTSQPMTIAELQQWYADRNLPPYDVTRFFLGMNVSQARAFGIYEENGEFIVYKNKDDGSRAIRYRGTDEAYAVNEIFEKLKSEILKQKDNKNARQGAHPGTRPPQLRAQSRQSSRCGGCVVGALVLTLFGAFGALIARPLMSILVFLPAIVAAVLVHKFVISRFRKDVKTYNTLRLVLGIVLVIYLLGGVTYIIEYDNRMTTPVYYNYGGTTYCWYDDDYYYWDGYDYIPVYYNDLPYDFTYDMDYYLMDSSSSYWDYSYDFESSDYYYDYIDDSSSGYSDYDYGSSDSDYDWDWGSDSSWDGGWDSGGSDWGSDW